MANVNIAVQTDAAGVAEPADEPAVKGLGEIIWHLIPWTDPVQLFSGRHPESSFVCEGLDEGFVVTDTYGVAPFNSVDAVHPRKDDDCFGRSLVRILFRSQNLISSQRMNSIGVI